MWKIETKCFEVLELNRPICETDFRSGNQKEMIELNKKRVWTETVIKVRPMEE